MAYGEKQFERDKTRFLSSMSRQRNPAGYEKFLNYQSARTAAEAVAKSTPKPKPNYEQNIKDIYQSVLGRAADPAGLKHFTEAATGGASIASIRDAIYNSPEAQAYRTPPKTEVGTKVEPYTPQTQDTSVYDEQIGALNEQISSLTRSFQSSLGSLTSQMQQERQEANKRLEEMQGNFAQAMAQRDTRPRIEGIRTPDKGTGGQTQQRLQRTGVRGSFGRSGDRLMKISSLNV